MNRISRRQFAGAALTAALATATGCTSTKKASAAKRVDHVTYLTGFGLLGREAYVHAAAAKGFFRDVGIDVTIEGGKAGQFNLTALAANQVQMAVIDFAQGLSVLGTGRSDFKMIAAVNQRTVIAIMALEGTGITRPSDLAGKTIAQATGAIPKKLFPAYAKLAKFDAGKVTWQETDPAQLPPLLAAGKVSAIGQFVMGSPTVEQVAHGRKAVVLPYGDYLEDLYGNAIMTSTKLLQTNPDLVRRFTGALMKGLAYAVANPDEVGQILHQSVPDVSPAVASAELSIMKPYVIPQGGSGAIGQFVPARVMRAIALMESVGQIPPNSLTPAKAVDDTMVSSS